MEMPLTSFGKRDLPSILSCRNRFNHCWWSFTCCKMKLLWVCFHPVPQVVTEPVRTVSEPLLLLRMEIWCCRVVSFSWLLLCCFCAFQTLSNTQLITYLLFQSCRELRGNYSVGDMQWGSASPRFSMPISLSAAPWNRMGISSRREGTGTEEQLQFIDVTAD